MKNSKMKEFEEKQIKEVSSLNQTEMGVVKGGAIGVTLAHDAWWNGNFWGHMFNGVKGDVVLDEFD